MAGTITTLAKVKLHLKIESGDTSNDDLLNQLITQVNAVICSYLGKNPAQDTYTDEKYNGNGTPYIFLKNYPVTSVTKAQRNDGTDNTPNWVDVDPETFSIDEEKGELIKPSGYWARGFRNHRFTYEAGYATIPADLELAANQLVAYYFNNGSTQGVRSESVDGASIVYSSENIPNDIKMLLNNYRSINV